MKNIARKVTDFTVSLIKELCRKNRGNFPKEWVVKSDKRKLYLARKKYTLKVELVKSVADIAFGGAFDEVLAFLVAFEGQSALNELSEIYSHLDGKQVKDSIVLSCEDMLKLKFTSSRSGIISSRNFQVTSPITAVFSDTTKATRLHLQ